MYRLSIVIPIATDIESFEDTLVSVLQNRPTACEVLVVHRGRYDDPYDLRDEVAFVEMPPTASPVEAINAGFRAARGEVVHLIEPGVLATADWTAPVLEHFGSPEVGAVAPLVIDGRDRGRIVSAGLRWAVGAGCVPNGAGLPLERIGRLAAVPVIGPTAAAAFYRRDVVDALDGYCPRAGATAADADLGLAFRALGLTCVLVPESVLLADHGVQRRPVSFAAARDAERVYWRYATVNGWPQAVLAHPLAVVGATLIGCLKPATYAGLLGRAVGALELVRLARHRGRLARAARRLDALRHAAFPRLRRWDPDREPRRRAA